MSIDRLSPLEGGIDVLTTTRRGRESAYTITLQPRWDETAQRIVRIHNLLVGADLDVSAECMAETPELVISRREGFSLHFPETYERTEVKLHPSKNPSQRLPLSFLTLFLPSKMNLITQASTLRADVKFGAPTLTKTSAKLFDIVSNPEFTMEDVRKIVDFYITGVEIEEP